MLRPSAHRQPTSVAHRSETHPTPSRANFMVLVMAVVFGFVGLGYLGAIIAYLIPRKGEGTRSQNLGRLTPDAIVSPGGTTYPFSAGVAGPFTYDATGRGDAQGIYVVQKDGTPGIARVLEQTCTHLDCPVAWTPSGSGGTFNCPCHGSVFNKTGQRIAGAAPRPFHTHDFTIKNGDLWVQGRHDAYRFS